MITVNGEELDLPSGQTLLELLNARHYRLEVIAVEHNGKILRREDYATTQLCAGDKLEVVSFVGGG